jgi:hypothetical protein
MLYIADLNWNEKDAKRVVCHAAIDAFYEGK